MAGSKVSINFRFCSTRTGKNFWFSNTQSQPSVSQPANHFKPKAKVYQKTVSEPLKGKFITFEGLDGSGKTTQLQLLADYLRSRSFDVVTTCEPGGTILGKQIRQVLLDKNSSVAPLTELLLFAADRAQHVQTLIRPNLERGNIVISDRYADATIAYQGAGRGFNVNLIQQIIEIATDDLKPDLTIFFDVSVEESLNRTTKRVTEGTAKNRLDEEKVEFYQRVRDAYLQIAQKESNRFRVVDASGSIENVHQEVLETFNLHFGTNWREVC